MYDSSVNDTLKEILTWCEDFLKQSGFIAGTQNISIADFSFLANISTLKDFGVFDPKEYPDLMAWMERCKKNVKNYEKNNQEGSEGLGNVFKSALDKIKNT